MKIQPLGDMIFLEIEKAKLGGLQTDSIKTGQEWAIIRGIGPEVKNKELKVGMKVFVKGWGTDIILYAGEDYYFTSEARKCICAILK